MMTAVRICLWLCLVGILMVQAQEAGHGSGGSWISSLKDRFFSFLKTGSTDIVSNEIKSEKLVKEGSSETALTSRETTEDPVAPSLQAAKTLIQEGELEKALDQLLDTVTKFPEHQQANAMAGALLLTFRQLEAAENLLFAAVHLSNWTDGTSVINLSNVLMLQGDTPLALKTLTKGYLTGDNNKDEKGAFSYQFGELYHNLTNYQKAREFYLAAATKMETNEEVWLKASSLLDPEAARDYKLAENVLLEAVNQTHRNSSELIFYLGYVMYVTDRLEAAITFFSQAARLNPENTQALSGLATAYHSQKDYNTAFTYYREYLQRKPDSPAMLANLAVLLKEIDRIEEAEKVLSRAYDLDANDPVVLRIMKQLNAVPATAANP